MSEATAAPLRLLVAPLSAQAFLPQKAHASDAGFDLAIPAERILAPYEHTAIDLEIAVQIPPGWYGQIFGRSSVFQRGIMVHPGVIDTDYRGPLQLLVYNRCATSYTVQRGDRLAQLLLLPVPTVTLTPVTPAELHATARGAGGVGSTGR
jgi:dUTP pyrophosphatase